MIKRDWQPVEGLDGFQVEMHISRPHGPVRHRRLPGRAWHKGYSAPDDVIRPSITLSATGLRGGPARRLLDEIDAKVEAAAKKAR